MKKFIICLVVLSFVTVVSSMAFGRTIEEERQAVRDYLNVVDAKLATAKQANNTERVTLLHAEKSATLARWNKLQIEMEAAPKPVAPVPVAAPAPVATPAPVPEKAAAAGIGMTINAGLDAGLTGISGNLDYDLSNMGAAGFKFRVGGNYIAGTNPSGGDAMKAVSLKVGALYDLSGVAKSLELPLGFYIGGAYLIPVKVNGGRTGKYGVEAYVGANYMFPGLGLLNGEVGYSELKYADTAPALKGIDFKLGLGYAF